MVVGTVTVLNSARELLQHAFRHFTPYLNRVPVSTNRRVHLIPSHLSRSILTPFNEIKDEKFHNQSIANILDCDLVDVDSIIEKYPFLRRMSTRLIQLKVNLFLSYNFSLSALKTNLRPISCHSYEELNRRLQLLKEKSFLNDSSFVKQENLVYFLECDSHNFDAAFKNLCSELDALEGCTNQCEYLQHRLKCTKETADSMLSSYPLSKHVSNCKMKSVLDFFLNEVKVGPEYVIKNKRFFSFSLTRLQQRWTIMQSAGVELEKYADFWNLTEKQFKKKFQEYSPQK